MAVSSFRILKTVYKELDTFTERIRDCSGFKPLDVEFRVNWACNANCVMCGQRRYFNKQSSERKRDMDYLEIIRVLDQLCDMGCRDITFSGGEPMLRKDIVDIVKYAAHICGMYVSVNTNGYLLTEAMLRRLIESGISSFTFSLDSPIEKIHDSIRGLKGSYKRIIRAIDFISRYRNIHSEKKIYIFINCVVLKNNIDSLHLFKDLHSKHTFDHLNFSPASIDTSWDEWTTSISNLRPEINDILVFKKMLVHVYEQYDHLDVEDPFGDSEKEIENNLYVRFKNRPQQCYIPYVHMVIQNNGDIIPCCYSPDEYIMGNVRSKTVNEIWNGEKYKSFRSECIPANYKMCCSCRQYETVNKKIMEKLSDGVLQKK